MRMLDYSVRNRGECGKIIAREKPRGQIGRDFVCARGVQGKENGGCAGCFAPVREERSSH